MSEVENILSLTDYDLELISKEKHISLYRVYVLNLLPTYYP